MPFFRRTIAETHLTADAISAYVDGAADGQAQKAAQHLARCAPCQTDLESLQATRLLLRSLPTVPVPRSFALHRSPVAVPRPSLNPLFTLRAVAVAAHGGSRHRRGCRYVRAPRHSGPADTRPAWYRRARPRNPLGLRQSPGGSSSSPSLERRRLHLPRSRWPGCAIGRGCLHGTPRRDRPAAGSAIPLAPGVGALGWASDPGRGRLLAAPAKPY